MSGPVIIEVLAIGGRIVPGPAYLKAYDPEAHDGRGHAALTRALDDALTFDDAAAALAFYRQMSTTRPTRKDGRPNRPLTACTIEIRPRELPEEVMPIEE